MRVPASYRWFAERYSKAVQDVLEELPQDISGLQVPVDLVEANPNGQEFDNLYIAMNRIIRRSLCRGADIPEKEMFENVTKYVDRLFNAIRPRRLLFLAMDGVAPRAKMSQQRSRWFRAAQDAREKEKAKDDVISEIISQRKAPPWGSNVIAPDTQFMSRISDYIRSYLNAG